MIERWATKEGTLHFVERAMIDPTKRRDLAGLTVSALGAATDLGSCSDEMDQCYQETLFQAAMGGVNFFDTAIHYRNQRSERVLGQVIANLSKHGIHRNELVIATRGGYLPYEGSFEDFIRNHYLDAGVI